MRSGVAVSLTEKREQQFLESIGIRIRVTRRHQKISRKTLAILSGVSERYLAQIETGSGNPSILLLKQIAEALSVSINDLTGVDEIDSEMLALLSSLRRAQADQRAEFFSFFEEWKKNAEEIRHQRFALIGLRGAGKSTLGQRVANELDIPFLEINQEIERQSGVSVAEVFSLYGDHGYRRLAQRVLRQIKSKHQKIILAVAGGVLVESDIFENLLGSFHTIWLRASPEEHMERVRMQGDNRPMANNPDAMQELREILQKRERYYMKAEATVDTSHTTIAQSSEALVSTINRLASVNDVDNRKKGN